VVSALGTRGGISLFDARVGRNREGKLTVRGTTADNGPVKRVLVNGTEARSLRGFFSEWEATLDAPAEELQPSAFAEDAAGNVAPGPGVTPVTSVTCHVAKCVCRFDSPRAGSGRRGVLR
jgi:hypothetical protein